jgi:beta-phosphoglucomutase
MARPLISVPPMNVRVTRNTKEPLHAVVFDMDGVIIDSHPAHRKAWRMFFQSMGREVTDSELDFVLDGRKRAEILRHFLGDLSDSELEEQGSRKDQFFQDLGPEVKPIPGIVDFLADLQQKKIAIAIATSASESRARSTLKRLGLIHHFRTIVTGEDVAKGKPDPSIYRVTCMRLCLEPPNVLAIEDAVSGVQAANGAGVRCVGVSGHEAPEELVAAGAECVIDNFIGASKIKLELLLQNSIAKPIVTSAH